MQNRISLGNLKEGETAVVRELSAGGRLRRRLQDIGLIKGTRVECIGISPMGAPAAYLIRGAVIALRSEDAAGIFVDDVGGTCVRRSNRLLTKNAGSMVTE